MGPAARLALAAACLLGLAASPPARRSPAPEPTKARAKGTTRAAAVPSPVGPAAKPAPRPSARPSDENRVRVEARLVTAREAYTQGRYTDVVTVLVKLLAELPTTPSQLVAVYELLASAYVALGQTELAVRCFAELLSRRPDYALDPVRISPKIRAALARARDSL
ncbi:MAG: tetratricopeptide repeat protein [Polyangia bacterium]